MIRVKKLAPLLYLLLLCLSPLRALAQSDLQISKVFDLYGKKKGVVTVNLSGEMLENYRLNRFRSISIKGDPEAALFARKCLEKDQAGAKKIKEVVSNGIPTSVFLQLPKSGMENRLILYNENREHDLLITLVYIETRDDAESILRLLLRKKQ
jgi:hypothetical protein